jgi:hypothetical protein
MLGIVILTVIMYMCWLELLEWLSEQESPVIRLRKLLKTLGR